jgi:hypothetical protein
MRYRIVVADAMGEVESHRAATREGACTVADMLRRRHRGRTVVICDEEHDGRVVDEAADPEDEK